MIEVLCSHYWPTWPILANNATSNSLSGNSDISSSSSSSRRSSSVSSALPQSEKVHAWYVSELFSQLPLFHLWSDAHVGAQPANLYLLIKGKFTRSPATSIFFDRKQEMKKHFQIRQHKHKRRSVSALGLLIFNMDHCCRWSTQRANDRCIQRSSRWAINSVWYIYSWNQNKQESESDWWEQGKRRRKWQHTGKLQMWSKLFLSNLSQKFQKATPWKLVFSSIKLVWVILRCWGKSSLVCQQKSDAL